jgi:uncharacterized protein YaiI (UPF0178 family)
MTEIPATTEIYVDADACPVREEVYRVAERLGLVVHLVSNGSRPFRPPPLPTARMVTVAEGADAADDWIAERIGAADICVTADIPLAARCLARGARALSPSGRVWTPDNIGGAPARERGRDRRTAATRPRRALAISLRPRRRGDGCAPRDQCPPIVVKSCAFSEVTPWNVTRVLSESVIVTEPPETV